MSWLGKWVGKWNGTWTGDASTASASYVQWPAPAAVFQLPIPMRAETQGTTTSVCALVCLDGITPVSRCCPARTRAALVVLKSPRAFSCCATPTQVRLFLATSVRAHTISTGIYQARMCRRAAQRDQRLLLLAAAYRAAC